MGNAYTNATKFKEWMPQRYLSELTNDTDNYSADDDIIEKALDWGAGEFESRIMVRSDIPVPAINSDNTVPIIVRECIHDLGLYRLYIRRGHTPQQVQLQYENQLQWLSDIVRRRANIIIKDGTKEVTKTSDSAVIDGEQKNKFTNFSFS